MKPEEAKQIKEEIDKLGWSYSVGYPNDWDKGFGHALRLVRSLIDRMEEG